MRCSAAWVIAVSMLGATVTASSCNAEALKARIEHLAARYGIAVSGTDHIGDEASRSGHATDPGRLIARLLADYNFVLARDANGMVTRLTIIGLRTALARPDSQSPATPRNAVSPPKTEHYIDAVLTGPNGKPVDQRLLIDTGATTLVLPSSMATILGFPTGQLESVRVQTANGLASGALAKLRTVEAGGKTAREVAVTFVDDGQLGDKRLLGMSFLGRFLLTIDGAVGDVRLDDRRN